MEVPTSIDNLLTGKAINIKLNIIISYEYIILALVTFCMKHVVWKPKNVLSFIDMKMNKMESMMMRFVSLFAIAKFPRI